MVDFLLPCLNIPEGMGSRLGGEEAQLFQTKRLLGDPKVSCNFVQDPYLFLG